MRMMIFTLLLLAIAPYALADADLALDVLSPRNGDRAGAGVTSSVSFSVRNHGAEAARDVVITIEADSAWLLFAQSFAGARCTPAVAQGRMVCRADSIAPGYGADVQLGLTSTEERALKLEITATSATPDPKPANNTLELSLLIARTKHRNDLSLRAVPEVAVARGETGVLRVEVENRGSDQFNVRLAARNAPPRDAFEITSSRPDVECRSDALFCTIPLLRRGETAAFEIRSKPLDRDDALPFALEIFGEDNLDLAAHNNTITTTIYVGDASEWERMLVPLTSGATMFIRAGHDVDVRPTPCEFAISECSNRWPHNERVELPHRAQFFYVRAKDADKVAMRARIGETAIPIPRGDDFTARTVSLLDVPHTSFVLRIYDASTIQNARVAIHVYGRNDTKPETFTARLHAFIEMKTTPARLPVFPAMVEFPSDIYPDLRPLEPPLRIDIEPLDPRQRLWSFITMSDHTTIISQQ